MAPELRSIRLAIRKALLALTHDFGKTPHETVLIAEERDHTTKKWVVATRAQTKTSSSEPSDRSAWIVSKPYATKIAAYRSLLRACDTQLRRTERKVHRAMDAVDAAMRERP